MAFSKAEKDELISDITKLISNGMSARKACESMRVYTSTYFDWLAKSEQYAKDHAKAMEARSDKIFEEILEIADDSSNDIKYTDNGEVINSEFVARSRLRVDARKWMLGKMQPKKYGDKLDLTTDGNPLPTPTIIIKDV